MLSLLTTSQIYIKCNVIQIINAVTVIQSKLWFTELHAGRPDWRKSIPKEDIPNSRLPVKQWNLTEKDQGKTHSGEEVPWVVSTSGMDSWAWRGWDWTISLRLGYTIFASELSSHMTRRGVGQCGSPASVFSNKFGFHSKTL